MVAALANSIFRGWQDLDTRMDCDHLKTHMPRYFFNLTKDIRTGSTQTVWNSKTKRPCVSKLWKWSRISVRNRILPVRTGAGGA